VALFLWLWPLSLKWFAFSAVVIAGLGVWTLLHKAALPPSRRRLLLFLAVASLSVWLVIDINFGFREHYPFAVLANGFNINVTDVLLAVLFLGWVGDLWAGRRKLHFPRPLLLLLAAMLGIHLVSAVFVAQEPFFAYSLIWRQIKVYWMVIFLANYLRDEADFKVVGYAMAFIAVFEALVVLEQRTLGVLFTPERLGADTRILSRAGAGTIERWAGTLSHPNVLAIFINTALIWVFFAIPVERQPVRRLALIVALAAGLGALVSTGSRSGWLGLAVALVVGIWLWPPGSGMPRKHPLVAIGAIVLTVTVGFAVLFASSETVQVRLLKGDAGAAAVRGPLMDVAMNMISAHPWVGVGLGQYVQSMRPYDRTLQRLAFTYNQPVHHAFLLKGAETGLPGMVVMILIFPVVFYYGWWVFRHSTGIVAVSGLAALGGMGAWLIQHQANPGELFMSPIVWVATGAMLAARNRLLEQSLIGALATDQLVGRRATATAAS
jgi:O-antigen ligase